MEKFGHLKVCPLCNLSLPRRNGVPTHFGQKHSMVELYLPTEAWVTSAQEEGNRSTRKLSFGNPHQDIYFSSINKKKKITASLRVKISPPSSLHKDKINNAVENSTIKWRNQGWFNTEFDNQYNSKEFWVSKKFELKDSRAERIPSSSICYQISDSEHWSSRNAPKLNQNKKTNHLNDASYCEVKYSLDSDNIRNRDSKEEFKIEDNSNKNLFELLEMVY